MKSKAELQLAFDLFMIQVTAKMRECNIIYDNLTLIPRQDKTMDEWQQNAAKLKSMLKNWEFADLFHEELIDIVTGVNEYAKEIEIAFADTNAPQLQVPEQESGEFEITEEMFKCMENFCKNALAGDPKAQHELGILKENDTQEEKAFLLYQSSAKQGYVPAMGRLALAYLLGIGTEVDLENAHLWALRGIKKNEGMSQYVMGLCYMYGQVVAIDQKEAFRWFSLSAEQGFPESQYKLAHCYMTGAGTEPDMINAMMWATIAGSQRHKDWDELNKTIFDNTTSEQAHEAIRRAKQWQAEHKPVEPDDTDFGGLFAVPIK